MAAFYEFAVDGEKWTSEDYTLAEMVTMETATGYKWWLLDFEHEASPQRAAIVAWYRRNMTEDDAGKAAGILTARDIRVRRIDGDDLPNVFENGIPVVGPGKADG